MIFASELYRLTFSSILAIDPGPTHSGVVAYDPTARRVSGAWQAVENAEVLMMASAFPAGALAIEHLAHYGSGMPVGREVFDTAVWVGRFVQAHYARTGVEPRLVFRGPVKLHLCGSSRAKDPNVRQALIDKLGPQGTKAAPGATYGVSGHAWAALAVAVYAAEVAP